MVKSLPDIVKRFALPLTVFLTGACILIIEIVATRILSPYYGNTIFTVSSVISVILAALSMGYHFGGHLADKHPSLRWFYGLIAISGLLVVVFHATGDAVLPGLSERLSLSVGPLVSSVALFFIPAMLLGTLSPYAVKLQSVRAPKEGIGTISGDIFFWSTLGSIVGSLGTGFILIPHFGLDQIVLAVGGVLFMLGFVPLVLLGSGSDKKAQQKLAVLAGAAVIFASIAPAVLSKPPRNTVYQKDGVYEKITIYDGFMGQRPVRFFQQDLSSSGAMFLDTKNPTDLVYDYTKYYSLYKVFSPKPDNALVIGGGAYSIPKALLHDEPQVRVDVSEIEPSLYDLSKQYFDVGDGKRLTPITKDGRRLLRENKKDYDYIFSDVYYSYYSIPSHFTTREFFATAKESLSDDGIFVANLIGSLGRQQPSLIMSEIRTFQSVFENSYFFATKSPSSPDLQNIIFVGSNSAQKFDLATKQVTTNQDPIIADLPAKRIRTERYELSPYPILADNYAPVDYLTSKLISYKAQTDPGLNMKALIDQQMRYGPRYIGSPGHQQMQQFLAAELASVDKIDTTVQAWSHTDKNGRKTNLANIIGKAYPERKRRIVLGTHYDTKKHSDTGPPVPGANDGASGVALLLELAHKIDDIDPSGEIGIDFVFFDGEEGEDHIRSDYSEWKPLGSNHFAANLPQLYGEGKPEAAIVFDMVCDQGLKLTREDSTPHAARPAETKFWETGREVNPALFGLPTTTAIRDDHTVLNTAGIPSFLVIDPDYPYFHTTADTADKCSPDNLGVVFKTVGKYLRELES